MRSRHGVLVLALLAGATQAQVQAQTQTQDQSADTPGLTSPAPPVIPVTPDAGPLPVLTPAPTPPVQSAPAPPLPTVQTPATPPPEATSPAPDPAPTPVPAPAPAAPAPPNDWQPRTAVELQALDKVTARNTVLNGKIGETLHFGSLSVTVTSCLARPPDQKTDYAAFLDITDSHPGAPGFHGWMLAAEPELSMLEHPLYDIRLSACH